MTTVQAIGHRQLGRPSINMQKISSADYGRQGPDLVARIRTQVNKRAGGARHHCHYRGRVARHK